MISSSAIDRKSVPENVMAMLIIEPYLKHFMPEINLPKSITSLKKTNMRMIFIMVATFMIFKLLFILVYKKILYFLYEMQ